MPRDASELARRLARDAEAVCRHYLSNGRRRGRYWTVGDVRNTPGRSMFVRLSGPDSGPGAAGHWTDAASAEYGDLLDVIRESCGFIDFRDVVDEARRFLSLPHEEPRRTPKPVRTPVPAGSPEAARRLIAMSQSRHMEKHWRLFQHLVHGDGDSAQKHREFYDEYLAVMDLCAEFYLQTCETVFIRHALPKGEMTHRGIPVDPAQIDCVALMTVEGEHDDISGVGQNRCGGLGLRVGSAAKVRCCGDCHRPGSGMSIFPLRIRADGTAFLRQGSTLSTGRLELG